MSGSQDKWNTRYLNKGLTVPSVSGYLRRNLDQLQPGSVLDVASGDGAASLFLAANGYHVTALDIAEEGLKRLSGFAKERGVTVQTQVCDLEQPETLTGMALFDNVVITLYKPALSLWPELVKHLKPDGRLLLTTFNMEHHRQSGFSKRFCLAPDELISIHPDLNLLDYSSTADDEHWMDHYLFQRR